MQRQPIQKPQHTTERQHTAHFPRFQPPVVPQQLPKTHYPTQGETRSDQYVRNDPQFNGVTNTTWTNKAENKFKDTTIR